MMILGLDLVIFMQEHQIEYLDRHTILFGETDINILMRVDIHFTEVWD